MTSTVQRCSSAHQESSDKPIAIVRVDFTGKGDWFHLCADCLRWLESNTWGGIAPARIEVL